MTERRPDPNKERNDPIDAEYWQLGEEVQDRILASGYQAEEVEGIAVDVHDLLQAADRIRTELAPRLASANGDGFVDAALALISEFDHVRWHCDAAEEFLRAAIAERQSSGG